MDKIKVTFLGTGDAIPTKLRNHTSILVEFKNEHILLDCGEGTQRQFKIAEISPNKLTRILITHWHGDHILGLPGLFQTLAMGNYSKELQIHGPKGTKHYISLMQQLFREFKINIHVHEISSGIIINEKDFYIEAREMNHGIPCLAYSIKLKDKIRIKKDKLKKLKIPNTPLLKELQKGKDIIINDKKIKAKDVTYLDKGKKISFILDTGNTPNAIKIAKNSDLLVAESTFSSAEKDIAKEYKHLTSEDAANITKKSKGKKLILTHISQRYEANLSQIEKEAKRIFRNTSIVKDFDTLEI